MKSVYVGICALIVSASHAAEQIPLGTIQCGSVQNVEIEIPITQYQIVAIPQTTTIKQTVQVTTPSSGPLSISCANSGSSGAASTSSAGPFTISCGSSGSSTGPLTVGCGSSGTASTSSAGPLTISCGSSGGSHYFPYHYMPGAVSALASPLGLIQLLPEPPLPDFPEPGFGWRIRLCRKVRAIRRDYRLEGRQQAIHFKHQFH